MIQPPIRSTDMRSDDIIYRRDDCQRSDGSTCWKLDTDTYLGDQLKPKLDPDLNQEALDKMAKKGEVPDDGWGMGGFWDLTPDVMDNEYFKMLATEELSQTNICCGEWRPDYHGCYKKGEMQDKQNNSVNPCDIDWCQRDARAMTATKMQFNGQRLWRLASDWSLLMLPKTLDAVKKFAQDEGAFHASFKAAWSKVISNGYSSGRLRQCTIERG